MPLPKSMAPCGTFLKIIQSASKNVVYPQCPRSGVSGGNGEEVLASLERGVLVANDQAEYECKAHRVAVRHQLRLLADCPKPVSAAARQKCLS